MSAKERPAYWAVLPATVRHDPDIPANAKILYAEISSLADRVGYCFASNDYFAGCLNLNLKSVQRLIKQLSDKGYIRVDVRRDPATKEVVERRIFVGINPAGESPPPSPQNCGDPSPQNCGDPSPQNCGVEQLNSFNNNTPYSPPTGGRRARKPPRAAPDWCADRFEGLWKYYPKEGRKNKQRAMDEWDRLRPDAALIDTIARALRVLNTTDEAWQRGIGIPHLHRFLRDRRWEDAEDHVETNGEPQRVGWADDPEVV